MSDGNADVSRRAFLRAGAGATAVSTAAGTAAAQETGTDGGGGGGEPEWPSYVDDANEGTYEDLRGESEVTIEAGSNYFDPTNVWVDAGTTITWEFVDPGHNVKPNDQPDGGSLEGTEGGVNAPVEQGNTYEVTLETGGMYTYFCGPHESLGMKGAIAVGGDVPMASAGGAATEVNPEHMGVPFHPHYVGVSTIVMMAVSLVFTFFLLKYGESPNASGGNN